MENGRQRTGVCDTCSREHLRAMESKLDQVTAVTELKGGDSASTTAGRGADRIDTMMRSRPPGAWLAEGCRRDGRRTDRRPAGMPEGAAGRAGTDERSAHPRDHRADREAGRSELGTNAARSHDSPMAGLAVAAGDGVGARRPHRLGGEGRPSVPDHLYQTPQLPGAACVSCSPRGLSCARGSWRTLSEGGVDGAEGVRLEAVRYAPQHGLGTPVDADLPVRRSDVGLHRLLAGSLALASLVSPDAPARSDPSPVVEV